MKPVTRNRVNKQSSAKQFQHNSRRTASANVAGSPMRGGWRL